MIGTKILFLSDEDVRACNVTASKAIEAIEDVFRRKSLGLAWSGPVQAVRRDGGGAVHAKLAGDRDLSVVKWFDYAPNRSCGDYPDYWPMIALTDTRTGCPVAVIDGRLISQLRTAGLTALAALRLASPRAKALGFIACGAQARAHFKMLASLFPIDTVLTSSRTRESAIQFAAEVTEAGISARATIDPQEVLAGADIIVSSVPVGTTRGFLDARELKLGAFVSMLDLGWSWKRDTLKALDLVVTDDLDHGGGASGYNSPAEIVHDLSMPVGGHDPGRRVGMMFAGTPLSDLALAALVYRRAVTIGRGHLAQI